jgi:uncharacterized protein YndB with AHSA1/START domain
LPDPSPYSLARGSELTRAPLVLGRAAHLGGSPELVFAFITDFERLPEWMPLMRRCRVDDTRAVTPGGVGAVRVIDSGVGKPTEETVVAFEAPRLLAYRASDASLRGMFTDHLGVLTCEAHPQGGTWLSWLSYARVGKPPQSWLGAGVFKYVIGHSLAQLERRFPAGS